MADNRTWYGDVRRLELPRPIDGVRGLGGVRHIHPEVGIDTRLHVRLYVRRTHPRASREPCAGDAALGSPDLALGAVSALWRVLHP
eukprot:3928720-Prymnesium_polylepis.1